MSCISALVKALGMKAILAIVALAESTTEGVDSHGALPTVARPKSVGGAPDAEDVPVMLPFPARA